MTRRLLFLICLAAGFGCAGHITLEYPHPTGNERNGTVNITFVRPVKDVHVTIDGRRVVNKKRAKQIVITNVPAGPRTLRIKAYREQYTPSVNENREITVEPQQETTIVIANAP